MRRAQRRVPRLLESMLALAFLPAQVVAVAAATVTVPTPAGDIVGSRHTTYERFGYIPYAQPPVGDLRWAAPRPMLELPGGRHDGSRADFRPACPQPKGALVDMGASDDQDEDCLFLFVWRPLGTNENSKLPVAVFTHGGAHMQGSGTDAYVNGESIASQNVLLVTINYRLGWLGFMNDVVDPPPGADVDTFAHPTPVAGALDNLEALRFIQRNIASLGGDPERVTVFGESAGASNCIFLLTSASMVERKEKLFQRIFLMSPAHLHFDIMEVENGPPEKLSALMDCPSPTGEDSYAAAWKCLRSKPWKDIWDRLPPQGASRIQYLMTLSPAFSGMQEVAFVQPRFPKGNPEWPTTPMNRVREGKIAEGVDVVVGQTRDEGSLFTKLAFMLFSTSDLDFFESMMRAALKEGAKKDTDSLIEHYLRLANQTSVWEAQVKFCGDIMFSVPVHLTLSTLAEKSPKTNLYSYVFSYAPGATFLGQDVGAAHGLELTFFFNALHQEGLYGKLESSGRNGQVMRLAQDMFVNFVRDGKSKCLNQYTSAERNFCEFSPDGELREIVDYSRETMDLWDAWISTAPLGWPTWGPKNEYAREPIVSWALNHVLLTELILLGEDWKRMVICAGLLLYIVWKAAGCCRPSHSKTE